MFMSTSDFEIQQNAYTGFDAVSLKQLMIDRLRKSDVFKDVDFDGSNISSLIDVIAYSNHLLLFYLNNTASESRFSSATLYENVNNLVKILSYNPVGANTSVLSFTATVSSGAPFIKGTLYRIPRYSYVTNNGYVYSFNTDISFVKTKDTGLEEVLSDISNQHLLYQGQYTLYPEQTTIGEDFEVIVMALDTNTVIVDFANIDVYVNETPGIDTGWVQWKRVDTLYTSAPDDESFAVRLNEYGRYELKFGNGVTGRKPAAGSLVQIVYLKSDGAAGQVDVGTINGGSLNLLNNYKLNTILSSVTGVVDGDTMTNEDTQYIIFTNQNASSNFTTRESIDSIKTNAVNTFRTQNRLVSVTDFINTIVAKFPNIVGSVTVLNNSTYIGNGGHMEYLKGLGLTSAITDDRVFSNRVLFGTATGFNNIYVYIVPKFIQTKDTDGRPPYLSNKQKEIILGVVEPLKTITADVVFMDPVYMAYDIGISDKNAKQDFPATLRITKASNSFVNNSIIAEQVYNILVDFFNPENNKLGQNVDIATLSNRILSVNGVKSISTEYNGVAYSGISFVRWDASYPSKTTVVQQNHNLDSFMFPYLNNPSLLKSKIVIS